VLKDVDDISMTFFDPRDVVRHPMVKRIVKAYDLHEAAAEKEAAKKDTTEQKFSRKGLNNQ